ncbi:MAG: response regulator [Spirochaetaceae bacterium]|nr:response regulator [Spirochaetaceae bacterium]MDT8298763.1 response regulator [Spirochaetaceae bacterium]
MSTILIVDDEPMVADVLTTLLTTYGHTVTTRTNSAEALDLIENTYDLYLFDLRMPDPNGAELTEAVMRIHPEARVLIMTAFPGDPIAAQALRAGAVALVKKPFEIGKILAHLNQAVSQRREK